MGKTLGKKKVKSQSKKLKTVYVKEPKKYSVHNGPWANTGALVGGALGGAYGGPIGQMAGEWIGRRAFHYPARYISGSGDYRVSGSITHTGSSNRISPPVPKFSMDKDGVCICHTEYIGDIITSSTPGQLKIQKFAINPSNLQTFPWLSSIASQSFQQYKFSGLGFQFKSYSADALNSTNTALGAFFTCINYDYTDDDFTTRSQIENSSWAQSCKPSDDVFIPVECKPSNTSMNGFLYVQNGPGTPPESDPRLYNLGKLFIGTTGFQGAGVNIGSLYVTYKVHFYKPIIPAPLITANYVNLIRQATGPTTPYGLSWNTVPQSCDSLGVSIDSSSQVMTIKRDHLPPGSKFLLGLIWYGTSTAISHPTISSTGCGSTLQWTTWSTPVLYLPNNGATSQRSAMFVEMLVDGDQTVPITVTLGTNGLYPTSGYMQIYITQRTGQADTDIGIYAGI